MRVDLMNRPIGKIKHDNGRACNAFECSGDGGKNDRVKQPWIISIGQPSFSYTANALRDGKPMHRESGFIKCHTDGQVCFVVADNLGVAYLLLGSLNDEDTDSSSIVLTSQSIASAPFNKEPRVTKARHMLYYHN
ncbi:THAP domain-containing protein 4 [Sparganum proliferum]